MDNLSKTNIEILVKLVSPKDVKECAFLASDFPREVSIKAIHEDYVIDCRRILGLYSLDLTLPIIISFTGVYANDEKLNKFDKWRVIEVINESNP